MNPSTIRSLKLLLFACLLAFSGCEKEPSPEPQFDSIEVELEYLVDQYVRTS